MGLDETKLATAALAVLNDVRDKMGRERVTDFERCENPEQWLDMARVAVSAYLTS